ncbi:hypothetical protein CCUS01_01448, partial [Colletotrichum cuscutae]
TKIFTRSLIYRYLKLVFKIKERGFKIVIPYLFYYLSGQRYKILEGKLRYYKCTRYSRSYDVTTSTIYNYKFFFFFFSFLLVFFILIILVVDRFLFKANKLKYKKEVEKLFF